MNGLKSSSKGILNKTLVMAALFAPLIEPSGLEDLNSFVGGIWRYLHLTTIAFKVFSFIVVFLISLKRIKRLEPIVWMLTAYQGLIAIMTFVNAGLSFSKITNLLNPVVATLLFQYYLKDDNAKKFLKAVQFVFGFYIVVNLITVISIPGGLYVDDRLWGDNWILGYRNLHIYYFLPFLCVSGINEYIENKKIGIRLYLLTAILIVSAFFCRSTTTLLGLALVSVLILLLANRKLPKAVNIKNICIASFIVSILFVFFSYQNYFAGFIENKLGKDATLSNRTLIWAQAATDFAKSPVFGYGWISYEGIFLTWDVGQMHNMFLDILIVGGTVLLALFALIIYVVSNKVSECKVPAMKNICMFVFIGYAVLFISEARRDTTMLFIFLSLCYNLPFLTERYMIKDNKRRIRFKFRSGLEKKASGGQKA